MFCTITLWTAIFLSSVVSRLQNVCVPLCGHDLFMFPCFYDGVPMFVVIGVVHVFAPLSHFLCVGTQSNKVNATKLKGIRNWCFLQVNKTMSLDPRLLLFLFCTFFFYFLIVLCLVVLPPFVLSLYKKLKGLKLELDQWSTLINVFFKWTRPQTLTNRLVVLLPFVFFLCVGSLDLLWLSCGLPTPLYFLMCRKLK